jgi:hypothetical protein
MERETRPRTTHAAEGMSQLPFFDAWAGEDALRLMPPLRLRLAGALPR